MSTSAATFARRARSGAVHAVVLERKRADGLWDMITALVRPSGAGFDALHRAVGLTEAEREELLAASTPAGGALEEWVVDTARDFLARAVVQSRVARRPLPSWWEEPGTPLEDLDALAEGVEDVYHCASCDAPLTPSVQVALARARGRAAAVLGCPKCADSAHVAEQDATPAPLAHAWLAWFAGDPRRALVHAARAEGQRVPAADLDAVRGAALLSLANPVEALGHLRRAVDAAPGDGWLHGLLVEALARAGYLASAVVEVERLSRRRPEVGAEAAIVRHALGTVLDAAGPAGPDRRLEHALEVFAAAC